jgi:predicted N-acetyltransferase YhbS
MQRRHEDEDQLHDVSATTTARALSAVRLVPRRRRLLPHSMVLRRGSRDPLSVSRSGILTAMPSSSFAIRLETDGDAFVLSELSAQAFGPGRFARSAYRVREGVPPVQALSLCAVLDARLVGGIRFTSIRIGEGEGALLLGPLVVDPAEKGKGYGKALVEEGLARAKAEGFRVVLLVGDMPYYGRFGFQPVPPGRITLPGPVDPARLLAVELVPGALAGATGGVKGYAC